MASYIGEQRPEWTAGLCDYAPKPGELNCNVDAEWHGIKLEDDQPDTAVGMSSCAAHLPIMRSVADFVHRHEHPCDIPGATFCESENKCRLDWDEAAEFTAAKAMAAI